MDTQQKPSLAELQHWMRQVFTEPRGITAALQDHPALLSSIASTPPLSPQDRLSVYSDAYFLRLLECLETDFPTIRRALGKDHFVQLAADYVQHHPSTSPNVGDLGNALPGFLPTHSLTSSFPFLPDLARLEWGVLESLHSERWPMMDPSALECIPSDAWPRAQFSLDPTVRLFTVEWAVDPAWEKRREPEKKKLPAMPHRATRQLLVYRDSDGLQLKVLDAPRLFALKRLQEAASLETVCNELAETFPKAAHLPIMDWFAHWLRSGVIKKIHLEGL